MTNKQNDDVTEKVTKIKIANLKIFSMNKVIKLAYLAKHFVYIII